MPIFSSGLPTLKPGSVRSTMKAEISLVLRAALVQHGAGNGNDDEHIGKTGVGDEDLGAVQQPAVLTLHGVGLLALGIGAGAGLGQAESAQPLAAAQLGQVLCLLLGGCRSHRWGPRTARCGPTG